MYSLLLGQMGAGVVLDGEEVFFKFIEFFLAEPLGHGDVGILNGFVDGNQQSAAGRKQNR